MHIRKVGGVTLMNESLVCVNYSDMNHHYNTFEKAVGKDHYKCISCGTVMIVREVTMVQNDRGQVSMQASVNYRGTEGNE